MRGEEMPGISAFLRVGDEVFHTYSYSTFGRGIEEFHNGYPWPDRAALDRQEAWEEPAGRAEPPGLQVGGPAMRLPDGYDIRTALRKLSAVRKPSVDVELVALGVPHPHRVVIEAAVA
jgi:hypothetical protein